MANKESFNFKLAKRLITASVIIIGFFIVYACVFVTLVLSSDENLMKITKSDEACLSCLKNNKNAVDLHVLLAHEKCFEYTSETKPVKSGKDQTPSPQNEDDGNRIICTIKTKCSANTTLVNIFKCLIGIIALSPLVVFFVAVYCCKKLIRISNEQVKKAGAR